MFQKRGIVLMHPISPEDERQIDEETKLFSRACDCEKALTSVLDSLDFNPLSSHGRAIMVAKAALAAALDEFMQRSGCGTENALLLEDPVEAAQALLAVGEPCLKDKRANRKSRRKR